MDRIQVTAEIPKSVAVAEGKVAFGETVYLPTEEEWGGTSADDRAWIVAKGATDEKPSWGRRIVLATTAVTWTAILDAVHAEQAVKKAEAEENAAHRERRIRELLDRPDEAWFTSGFRDQNGWSWTHIDPAIADDSRIVDRVKTLMPEMARRRSAWRAETEAEELRTTAEKAARTAERERLEAEASEGFKAFAASLGGAFARGVEEDYDVVSGVMQHVGEQIRALDPEHSSVLIEGTKAWKRAAWSERESPRDAAFAMRDRVTAHVEAMPKPVGLTIEVSRIQRFDPNPEDNGPIFTAVIVFLSSPLLGTQRAIVFQAE